VVAGAKDGATGIGGVGDFLTTNSVFGDPLALASLKIGALVAVGPPPAALLARVWDCKRWVTGFWHGVGGPNVLAGRRAGAIGNWRDDADKLGLF
jgi:hypothetical protein